MKITINGKEVESGTIKIEYDEKYIEIVPGHSGLLRVRKVCAQDDQISVLSKATNVIMIG